MALTALQVVLSRTGAGSLATVITTRVQVNRVHWSCLCMFINIVPGFRGEVQEFRCWLQVNRAKQNNLKCASISLTDSQYVVSFPCNLTFSDTGIENPHLLGVSPLTNCTCVRSYYAPLPDVSSHA